MKLKLNRASGVDAPLRRTVAVGVTTAVACGALVFGGILPTAGAADPATVDDIILLVGANETQRVVSWYASADTAQVVQVVPTSELVDGEFPADATDYAGVVTANTVGGGFNGRAVITGLQEKTDYSYRIGEEGEWSRAYEFSTQKFEGNFDFLFFGDPQIGSSGNVPLDTAGWEATLDVALDANPKAELLVSGGDQVNTANNETEWDGFLAPDELREVPWAATIGNHDVGGRAYEQHMWTPNTDRSPSFYRSGNLAAQSGGDYWFLHKGVLFIDLNSNAYASSGAPGVDADEAHIQYVSDVIEEHGGEAEHTVLVYHHSIYSPADHANDGDNQERREDFPTAFSELGVDLVLQGHDHSYSRSYLIRNGEKANPDEQPGAETVFQGPGGVIYVTANSASGSKYYDLTDPNVEEDPLYGPDPLNPDNHWANSVENQEHVRTYVKVSVRDNLLKVENVRAGTCEAPNAAVELGRTDGDWCGPDEGAVEAQPVGSLVDKVVIHPYRAPADGKDDGTDNGTTTSQQDGKVTVTSLS